MLLNDDIAALFVEKTEQPLKTIKQVGPQRSPKAPVRQIAWADGGRESAKPFMRMLASGLAPPICPLHTHTFMDPLTLVGVSAGKGRGWAADPEGSGTV